MHGKTAPSHNRSNYEGGNRVNVSEQFHLATISFFSSKWFSVFGVGLVHWTAIILWRWPLLSIFCLHPSSHYTQSKRKARRTTEAVANGNTARSKEDEPIYQPSRVFRTKSGRSRKTWETWRHERCWEGRKEVPKQEMKLDYRGLTAPGRLFVWADLLMRSFSSIFL